MDVESLAKQLILQNMTPEQQKAVLDSVRATLQEARGKQKQRVSENVGMVVDALKKIEADIRAKYDDLGNKITARVNSIRDGRDGINGSDGRDGQDGRPGRDGAPGPAGPAGRDGINGIDGKDGVSVIDAKIDFDGSLIISLSNGREINVGEVVAADVAEKIRVLTYGGNSGGSGTSGLTYKGTWNASTNTPTLITSSGTNGDYYIVSVAGTTDLNGITDWQPGDWVIFNGTVWQKIDQSWATAGANNNITSMTGITGGISSPDFVQFDTGATVTNAAGRLYWDATQQTLTVGLNANIAADIGQTLYAYATNDEAVTINKGQPVYMFSAQGDRVSVKLAYNTGDATSAKTLGICAENIAAGQAGMILCQGVQDGLDLSAYTAGDTLYLGATAGTLTSTKPYAPNHLVYIGVVERANAGNGRLYVRVQNGYEMDELHNVSAQNPSNGQVLIYNASTSLWEKNTLTDGTGITITEGAGSITVANAGVTSAVAGTGISVSSGTGAVTITNTAPDQTVALTGAGTTSITGTYPNFTVTSNDQYTGTVTSVSGTGTVNGLSLSGTVTSSGSLTLGGTLSGTASINIDGTVGATTPAAGTFTSLTDSGNLTFTGTGSRIIGDFNSGTIANRVLFQTTTANVQTGVGAIPNGTSTDASFQVFNSSSATNCSRTTIAVSATESSYRADRIGTGTYLPMTFYTSGAEAMRIDTSGNVGIGISPTELLQVNAGAGATARAIVGGGSTAVLVINGDRDNSGDTGTEDASLIFQVDGAYSNALNSGLGSNGFRLGLLNGTGTNSLSFVSVLNSVDSEVMRLDSSGNVGVGRTADAGYILDIANPDTASGADTFVRISSSASAGDADAELIIDAKGSGEATLRLREDGVDRAAVYSLGDGDNFVSSNILTSSDLLLNGAVTTINDTYSLRYSRATGLAPVTGVTGTITSSANTSTITGLSTTTGLVVGMVLTKTAGTGVLGTQACIQSIDSASQITVANGFAAMTAGSITFTATPSPSTITAHSESSGTWAVDQDFARFAFSNPDSSGAGDGGIRASINAYSYDTAGTGAGLDFYVSSNGTTLTKSLRLTQTGVYGTTVGATFRTAYIDNTGVLGGLTSLRAAKTNIAEINDTNWLLLLKPVMFNYRLRDISGNWTDESANRVEYGLIADDVEEIKPELCIYDDDENKTGLRGIEYGRLITPMLKLLQEQQKAIDAMKVELAALKGQ